MLTGAEIEAAAPVADAYTLVRRLRPLWLHRRGPKSLLFDGDIVVYEDEMASGPPSVLRFIAVTDVATMRFLTPGEATTRFGAGHEYGAIVVQKRGL